MRHLYSLIFFLWILVTSTNAQTPLFALNDGGTAPDFGYRVTKDQNGNLYYTGGFQGTVDFDPGPGVFNLTSNGSRDIFIAKYSPAGLFIWAISIGGTDLDGGFDITTDNLSNVYVTGFFRGVADFDPSPAVFNLTSNGDAGGDPGYGGEVFVAKYSAGGGMQWAFSIGGTTKFDNGQSIQIAPNGDVLVGGYFVGSNVDFDPSPAGVFGLGDNSEQQFFARYTAAGAFIWAKELGTPINVNETVRDMTTDPAGNIYLTGYFTLQADFDPGPGTTLLTATSEHEGYIAKYTPTGDLIWVYKFGGTGDNEGLGIDYSNGSLIFTGVVTNGPFTFNHSGGATNINGLGAADIFLASITTNGLLNYVKILGGTGNDIGFKPRVDPANGQIYLTGYFSGTADFNPDPAQTATLNSAGGTDIFVARFLNNGSYSNAFRVGGAFDDAGIGLILDNGSFIISGYFSDLNVDFDPTTGTRILNTNGNFDAFLAKYAWNNIVQLCTGSLGDPVVKIDFGTGNNPAPDLPSIVPGASSTLSFIAVNGNPATPTPIDGQYTITNNIPSNAAWFSGQPDHTPNDVNGRMAFYNSQEIAGLEFYKQTVTGLCGGTTYEFAAWIANCLNPAALNGVDPDITFVIESSTGLTLGTFNTGPISESTTLQWNQYGFYFTLPATESAVVLKMINNAVGGIAQPGNDLAIDDITFRPCGPKLTASFSTVQQVDTFETCEGQPVNLYSLLSVGYNNPSYRWQTSTDNLLWIDAPNSGFTNFTVTAAPSTNYYYYRAVAADGTNINSLNCRIVSNTLVLKVNAAPQGSLKGDTICINTPGHFTFTALQGQAPFTITYRDPSGTVFVQPNVAATATFATPNPVTANTVFTLLSIRDANGCERLANFNDPTITISLRQVVFQAPTATQTTCQNTAVSLSGNNGNNYRYLWSPATYLNDPTAQNPVSTPANTITYTLRLTEPVCNTDSNFQVTVNVNPNPVITVQKTNDINCKQDFAQLNATGGNTYSWSPATGLNSTTIANPIATPPVTTTYTVKATNSLGCNSTETVTVSVDYSTGKSIFEVPNAFTPNNDGRNDCFGIRNWNTVTILDFSVYNRWGQLVFTTKNRAKCWDGRVNGVLQPTGGYTYVIRTSSPCGNVEKKGVVMLIR